MEITTTDAIGTIQHDVLIDGRDVGTIMLSLLSEEGASGVSVMARIDVTGARMVYIAFYGDVADDDARQRKFASYGEAMDWIVARHKGLRC